MIQFSKVTYGQWCINNKSNGVNICPCMQMREIECLSAMQQFQREQKQLPNEWDENY